LGAGQEQLVMEQETSDILADTLFLFKSSGIRFRRAPVTPTQRMTCEGA
jgi:hypothetical protein